MKKSSFFQFVKFMLMGLVGSTVELVLFWLCNFILFKNLSEKSVSWFIFSYSASNGGLCAFLSMLVSFAIAQATNFAVQRKVTFKSKGSPVLSAVLYTVMVLAVYAYVLWLPSLIGPYFYKVLGSVAGAFAVKIISQFTSALIQFPLNKFVVMR